MTEQIRPHPYKPNCFIKGSVVLPESDVVFQICFQQKNTIIIINRSCKCFEC